MSTLFINIKMIHGTNPYRNYIIQNTQETDSSASSAGTSSPKADYLLFENEIEIQD